MADEKNRLYYGDNLDVLREYVATESVDLVYLDPPFNSRQDYNVLFAEKDGNRSAAQITAFKDTWEWNREASLAYQDVVEGGGQVAETMRAFHTLLGGSDMLAYLSMMAPRLVELRRVLKQTGSIYLHCDPTASHYLKLLMDGVFGAENFRSEIVWRRTGSHNKAKRWAPIHDVILFARKSKKATWNHPRRPYMLGHVEENFAEQNDGTYKTDYYGNVLTGSGTRNKESGAPWRGFDPTAKARHWAISSQLADQLDEDLTGLSQHEKLDRLFEAGLIKIEAGASWPIPEYTVDPNRGPAAPDIWAFQPYTEGKVYGTKLGIDADVAWLKPQDQERLGYPTQKPEALLERILKASSNEGDVVLDPFCGCGTTVQVAQKLNRRWIGVDITHLAIGLIKTRLDDTFGHDVRKTYEVIGEPTDVAGAEQLANDNKYQFQYWALGQCGARPTEGIKKGADRGIDGRLYFHDDNSGKSKQVIFSVKGGRNVGVAEVRDLIGVLDREKAEIGVYISFAEPTGPMKREAAEAGFYTSSDGSRYPRVQLLTIRDLIEGGKKVERPMHVRDVTFKQAPRARGQKASNLQLDLGGEA